MTWKNASHKVESLRRVFLKEIMSHYVFVTMMLWAVLQWFTELIFHLVFGRAESCDH